MHWLFVTMAIAVVSSACVARLPVEPVRPSSSTTQAAPSPTAEASTEDPAAPLFTALAFFDRDRGLLAGAEVVGADSGSNAGTGLLWRTGDGGATWGPVAFDGDPITTFAISGAGNVWAATGCPDGSCRGAVMASVDAGQTWSTVSGISVTSLSFVDVKHGWAVTQNAPPSGGDLLETRDGGRTWSVLRRPCPIGIAVATSFVTDDRGWLGCGALAGAGQEPKAVLETTDGGRTWIVRSEAGINVSIGTISSADYVAGIAMRRSGVGLMWMTRGSTTRTTNAGRVWRSIPPGEFDVSLPASAAVLDDRTWFLLLWDGNLGRETIEVTRDGGSTWLELGGLPA